VLQKDHKTYTDNIDKASLLNDKFSSDFTIENNSLDQLPPIEISSFQPLSVDGIINLLKFECSQVTQS